MLSCFPVHLTPPVLWGWERSAILDCSPQQTPKAKLWGGSGEEILQASAQNTFDFTDLEKVRG